MENNSEQFRILLLCTGNVCRSPLAAQLLGNRLRDVPDITVASAGIRALVGTTMPAPAQDIARKLGVSKPDEHRGLQVSVDLLESADLILVMAREHRRAVVKMAPSVTRKTFTLREFSRLAQATSDSDLATEIGNHSASSIERLQAAVRAVTFSRELFQPLSNPTDDDVTDPYMQNQKIYSQSADEMLPAVEETASLLRKSLAFPIEGESDAKR